MNQINRKQRNHPIPNSSSDEVVNPLFSRMGDLDVEEELLDEPEVPPHVQGEQFAAGHMPHVTSDDDVMEDLVQPMGIAQDADEEHPQELNIAQDVENAEKSVRDR